MFSFNSFSAQYLIKWEGYDDENDNTWEPSENIPGALKDEFNEKRRQLKLAKKRKDQMRLEELAEEKKAKEARKEEAGEPQEAKEVKETKETKEPRPKDRDKDQRSDTSKKSAKVRV